MTSIDFYFNAADRLQVACRLAGRALAADDIEFNGMATRAEQPRGGEGQRAPLALPVDPDEQQSQRHAERADLFSGQRLEIGAPGNRAGAFLRAAAVGNG